MTNIITLDDDISGDKGYLEFLDDLKEDVVKAIFLVEKADGLYYIGTRSKDKKSLIADIYRLQSLAQRLVYELDEEPEVED